MNTPDFYTGAPIDPPDLWFRDEFIGELWDLLQTRHLILSAPRRTGKTSILDFLAANPRSGFVPISVFVQDISHPADFIFLMLDLFHEKHPNLFRKFFATGSLLIGKALAFLNEVEVGGLKITLRHQDPDWQNNWKSYGDEFFDVVRKEDCRILMLVDEFPDMILNMHNAHPHMVKPFLEWFRGHRMKPHPKYDTVRWMICGSANLSSTLDALGCLDKTNDLTDIPLPVLTCDQVREFVTKMLTGRNVQFEVEVPGMVALGLGRPVPVFLQMITQDLYRIWNRTEHPLSGVDVEKAFADLIVSSGARDKLQHFYSRIAQYYKTPKDIAAHKILAGLSLSPDGITRDSLFSLFDQILHEQGNKLPAFQRKQVFNQLLRDLENDFYVVEISNGVYDFASGLIKQWWRKYYA